MKVKSNLKTVFEKERQRLQVNWNILEQDYLLSWILFGIASVEELQSYLVFKGGTCLKKCYFGEYRFSEDLDFTALDSCPKDVHLENLISLVCTNTEKLMSKYIPNPKIISSRYIERAPHPEGQEAFVIKGKLPWQNEPLTKVMVEITMTEKILTPIIRKPILHGYSEEYNASLKVYSLEEIIIEKLRAILQFTKKLHERGWSRSRSRDYYDLWRIFTDYSNEINFDGLLHKLKEKCNIKDIEFSGVDDFFQENAISIAFKDWEKWLQPLVPNLSPFEIVMRDLKKNINELISFNK